MGTRKTEAKISRRLKVFWCGCTPIRYRPWTNDLAVINEVIGRNVYTRKRIDFYINPGETWLDLGAHIGSFSCLVLDCGGTPIAYEPLPENYKILKQNIGDDGLCINKAVGLENGFRSSWILSNPSKQTRLTMVSQESNRMMKKGDKIETINMSLLCNREYDGIKMDVEGLEGPIIDERLIPKCNKLVLEYHTSRDRSAKRLGRRIEILRDLFETVDYQPDVDTRIKSGGQVRKDQMNLDRLIWCKGWKST